MTWTVTPAGSWAIATTDTPADYTGALALPGSWCFFAGTRLFVRKDQVTNLPNLGAGQKPTVTTVAPTGGPVAGGTPVTITGTNLLGAQTVTFGSSVATAVEPVSATSLTCVSPPNNAGSVAVAVTTLFGTGSKSTAFTFS